MHPILAIYTAIATEFENNHDPDEGQVNYESNEDGDEPTISVDPSWENAHFLLRVTQEQSLTYDGVERFCDCMQDYTEMLCEKMAHQAKQKLADL